MLSKRDDEFFCGLIEWEQNVRIEFQTWIEIHSYISISEFVGRRFFFFFHVQMILGCEVVASSRIVVKLLKSNLDQD